MTRSLLALALGLSLGLASPIVAGDADMARVGDIMVHDGWARASIGKAPNSAAYMTLMTEGAETDKLIQVTTPLADRAELHNHLMEDGIAKMREVEAIEIAPGEATPLKPGGLHVMLIGLKEKLAEGSSLPLTLTFEKAGEITLELPILGIKGGKKKGEGHHHHGS